jgi:hypothetical protein
MLLAFVTVVFACISYSQTGRFSTTVILKDAGGVDSTKLVLGYATNATDCIDSVLGEYEQPPFPPAGSIAAYFTEYPCLGQGLIVDYHPGITTGTPAADTFQIKFQPGDAGYPMTFYWSPHLASYFSSMKLQDEFGGILVNVNMLTSDSATITNAAITSLYILYTPDLLTPGENTGVKVQKSSVPSAFALNQNYPNPFNPTTTIKFAIEKASVATVTVYNILGQTVATLVHNQQMNAGYYTTNWNGVDDRGMQVGSGVYFVRMTASYKDASTAQDKNFTAVQKIVLMK